MSFWSQKKQIEPDLEARIEMLEYRLKNLGLDELTGRVGSLEDKVHGRRSGAIYRIFGPYGSKFADRDKLEALEKFLGVEYQSTTATGYVKVKK